MSETHPTRSDWRIIGPGGGGAQFYPTISPHDPDTILVACDMTGSYVTRNRGVSWKQFNFRTGVDSFAFDPIDRDVIYAGSTGLCRSDDCGDTWRLVFPKPSPALTETMSDDEADHSYVGDAVWKGGAIQAIYIDPKDSGRIYIAAHRSGTITVYLSENGGNDFRVCSEVRARRVYRLLVIRTKDEREDTVHLVTEAGIVTPAPDDENPMRLPPKASSIIDAAYGRNPDTNAIMLYVTAWMRRDDGSRTTHVWHTADLGNSWERIDARIDRDEADEGLSREYARLAVPEIDGRCIYLGIGSLQWIYNGGYQEYAEASSTGTLYSYYGVLKSLDAGRSWSWVFKTTYDASAENVSEGWAERDYGYAWYLNGPKGMGPVGLGVSPVSTDLCCYTDLSSTFLTADGGASWKQLYTDEHPDGSVSTRGLDVTTCYGVHFDPFDANHLAISYTDIGTFHSLNGGESWLHAMKGVPIMWGNTCYWMVFDPDVPGRIWSVWGSAHDLPRAKMFRSGLFHLSVGGVLKSDDGMRNWRRSNDGMSENSVTTHILLDPKSPPNNRTLYATVFGVGVMKSSDDGNTWAPMNEGLSGNLNAWRIVSTHEGVLYLIVARGMHRNRPVPGALYRSTDASHWVELPLPEGVDAPTDLAVDPEYPNRIYLACWPSENIEDNRHGGLYVADDGLTWKNIFDPAFYVYGVTVFEDDPSRVIIVTFNGAAFGSKDRGRTWVKIPGYDFKWGHRAVPDPHNDDMIYITTFGSSVWHGPAFEIDEENRR